MAEEMEARIVGLEQQLSKMSDNFNQLLRFMKGNGTSSGESEHRNEEEKPKVDPEDTYMVDNPLFEKKMKEEKLKLEVLEKRMRAIEGGTLMGSLTVEDLCLVPNVVIPADLKVPEFVKYDGTTCPKTHLTLFLRKIQPLTKDENVWIVFFQDSLEKSPLQWYLSLGPKNVNTWNDLVQAFVNNYRHVMDLAPDRQTLQNLEKKKEETFKEYAQRWRDLAAQVRPPMTEREMVTLFVQTLKYPFYDKLIGNSTNSFSDIALSGERIEYGIKTGKIAEHDGKRGGSSRKNEEEVHQVEKGRESPLTMVTATGPRPLHAVIPSSSAKKRETFTPIPVTYTELYPKLIGNELVQPIQAKQIQPPYPKWYDRDAICEYHGGVGGHSLENCYALKRKVQQLLDGKMLDFESQKGM